MLRSFNVERTAQAAAVILSTAGGGAMNYTLLLKLLYLADRRAMELSGFPITGDDPYAMKHGPVLSKTYDLIKGSTRQADLIHDLPNWKQWIRTVNDYQVQLAADPGHRKLSRFERRILIDISQRYSGQDVWELVSHLHETLPEWKNSYIPDGSSHPISPREILDAVGQSANVAYILETAEEHRLISESTRPGGAL